MMQNLNCIRALHSIDMLIMEGLTGFGLYLYFPRHRIHKT